MQKNSEGIIKITRPAVSEDEATEKKLKQLESRILGFKVMSFEIVSNDYVYVPYRFYRYGFQVNRKTLINKSGQFDKQGELTVIFDNNEAHPFECDINEMGELDFVDIDLSEKKGEILSVACGKDEAREETEYFIQNKILRRIYASTGNIEQLEDVAFYRPAKRLTIQYKNNPNSLNERFAYLDAYGVVSEHILGLKVRVGGGV